MKKKIFKVFLVLPLLALNFIPSAVNAVSENVYEFDGNTFNIERFDVVEREDAFVVTVVAKMKVTDNYKFAKSFAMVIMGMPGHPAPVSERYDGIKITSKYNGEVAVVWDETGVYEYTETNGNASVLGTGPGHASMVLDNKGELISGTYTIEILYKKRAFTLSDFDNVYPTVYGNQSEIFAFQKRNDFTPNLKLTHVNGATYTGESPYIVSVNYDKDLFSSVAIDGETVDPSNYEVTLGSTIVMFKDDYMESLSKGQHTIDINYANGFVSSSTFNMDYTAPIVPKPDTTTEPAKKAAPLTGDTTSISTITSLMTLVGLVIIIAIRKQKA